MAFNVEEVCDQLQEALRFFVRHSKTEMDHVAYLADNAVGPLERPVGE
jgi:hypothetical protein